MVEEKNPNVDLPDSGKSVKSTKTETAKAYWKDNLTVVAILLSIWFVVGFVGGIFGISWLNGFKVGKIGLGFWIAQQGSIFVFVLLVLAYALWMDRIDRKHRVGDEK